MRRDHKSPANSGLGTQMRKIDPEGLGRELWASWESRAHGGYSQTEGLGSRLRQSLRWEPGRPYPFLLFSNQ